MVSPILTVEQKGVVRPGQVPQSLAEPCPQELPRREVLGTNTDTQAVSHRRACVPGAFTLLKPNVLILGLLQNNPGWGEGDCTE